MKRRLLILTFHAPPSAEVAAKPTAALATRLAQRGWEVVMVVPELEFVLQRDEAAFDRFDPRIVLVRAAVGFHHSLVLVRLRQLQNRLKGRPAGLADLLNQAAASYQTRLESNSPPTSPRVKVTDAHVSTFARIPSWRVKLRDSLRYPYGIFSGWVGPAARAAIRLHREQPFDVMVSISPPHIVQMAALRVKRRVPNLPWVMQWHDPWTLNPFRSWSLTWLNRWEERDERAALAAADLVLLATAEAAQRHHNHFPGLARFQGLELGFDPDLFETPAPTTVLDFNDPSGPLIITHAGTLYGHRDPSALFDALALLVSRGELGPNDLRVRFLGDCRSIGGRSVEDLARSRGVAPWVELIGTVPHRQALDAQAQSDALLLLAENQPDQIPAKVFEALHLRRPTLALCDGASARLVAETGIGPVFHSGQVEAIAATLRDWLQRRRQGRPLLDQPSRAEAIAHYHLDQVAARFEAALEETIQRVSDGQRPHHAQVTPPNSPSDHPASFIP